MFKTFCRMEATNILQCVCCRQFPGWTLQIFCRVDAAIILQSGGCQLFKVGIFFVGLNLQEFDAEHILQREVYTHFSE